MRLRSSGRCKEGDGPGNEERKRLGMPSLHTDGWHVPPHYDVESKRLEWGLRLRGEGGASVVNPSSSPSGASGGTAVDSA